MSQLIGRTPSHYRVISAIGAGGMGEVYRATDTTLGRDVAIKVLPSDVGRDADRLSRFRREADLLASLNHPNIAAIYGLEEADGTLWRSRHSTALVRTSQPVHDKTSDLKGPAIRGITFTQYAYRALEVEGKKRFTAADEPTDEPVGQPDPSTFGKEVVGTLLELVTISYCSRVAGYFRGDGLIIRNSLICHTSTEGIYVIGSSDVLLERNIIRRNNVLIGLVAGALVRW